MSLPINRAGHEGNGALPMVLQFVCSERLTTGELVLVVQCKSDAEFFCMPQDLVVRGYRLVKTRRDATRGVALYVAQGRLGKPQEQREK